MTTFSAHDAFNNVRIHHVQPSRSAQTLRSDEAVAALLRGGCNEADRRGAELLPYQTSVSYALERSAVMDLYENLNFVVLDGVFVPADVASAMPFACRRIGQIPRRKVLFATLHDGGFESEQQRHFAIFSHAKKTLMTTPSWCVNVGEWSFERALSQRFGGLAVFQSFFGAPRVALYRNDALLGEVTEFECKPKGGVLGATKPLVPTFGFIFRELLLQYVGASREELFFAKDATAELWCFDS